MDLVRLHIVMHSGLLGVMRERNWLAPGRGRLLQRLAPNIRHDD
ncbi:MAG: hypothetical protein WCB49_00140 [Gammaproteobacteria bacterium]